MYQFLVTLIQPCVGKINNSVSSSMYVDRSIGSVLLQTATAEVVRPDN